MQKILLDKDSIRTEAKNLSAKLRNLIPPIDAYKAAYYCGIKKVNLASIKSDGYLVKERDGFSVFLKEKNSVARQRFTMAHEIGHIILGLRDTKDRNYCFIDHEIDNEEEKLCNIFASELLMPSEIVLNFINKDPLLQTSVKDLAKNCEVSLSASVWRLTELHPDDVGFIWFKEMGSPTKPDKIKLRLDWGCFPKRERTYLPKFDAVKTKSLIWSCYSQNKITSEVEKVSFGNIKGEFFIHCTPYKKAALVIFMPAKYSAYMSEDNYQTVNLQAVSLW